MIKTVIFHFEYQSKNNKGNRTEKKHFSIFNSKSDITEEFVIWCNLELDKITEIIKEDVYMMNPKIINL